MPDEQQAVDTTIFMLDLKQLAAVLIRERGLKDGLYEAVMELQVSIGNFTVQGAHAGPGVVANVIKVGLAASAASAPNAVDAKTVWTKQAARPAAVAAPVSPDKRKRGSAKAAA